jgi:hypothetical protein
MKFVHRLLMSICGAAIALSARADAAWPDVAIPEGAHVASVARHSTLNGIPMQIEVFSSRISVAELLDYYRHEWGAQHVENRLRGMTIIGRAKGEFYTTVQIRPAPHGSQGVIAVARMNAAVQTQNGGFQLPPGSRILSDMESEDLGKISRHLVFTNTCSVDVNRDRLVELMHEKGLSLERIGKPGETDGGALFFKGRNKEAIAVIVQKSGQTSVVLNITSQLTETR